MLLPLSPEGVLLPLPPSWGWGRPLRVGADSLGFGGRGGRAGAWRRRPGGEEASLCMGGRDMEAEGVERPEDGRERSLLTGILLGSPLAPWSPASLAITPACLVLPSLLLPLRAPPRYWRHWAPAPGSSAGALAPRRNWAAREGGGGHFPWAENRSAGRGQGLKLPGEAVSGRNS